MAEAIAISLSGKLAVALSRSAALGISLLIGVRSDIAAAKRELDLLRAFLRFADSRRGSTGTEDDHVAEWVRQVRDAAFELEDVADECSYLSVHGFAKDLVNVKAWLAVSRRLRKARERLSHLSAIKGQYGILEELHLHCDRDDDGNRSLVAAVRRHLGKRRYLIVLDDVWDAHLWDTLLRHAFLDDATGSRVVITTRSRDVAMAAVRERIMTLQPLPWREAWTLFSNVAFRSWSREREEAASDTDDSRTCPSHLKELAGSLLDRCGGLPLAIVSIGNLLALKERTVFAWKNVHDSLVWDKSSSDLGIGEAASILNLGIDDLPHHLKRCFLSCSIYSEDFLIKRNSMHGSAATRTLEDVADDYLDQLVHRSLIQVTETNEFGRAKRCLIHDLIRDLIMQRSRGEGFFQFTKRRITTNADMVHQGIGTHTVRLSLEIRPDTNEHLTS